MRQLMKRSSTREILWLFLATRLILFCVSYVGNILLIQGNYTNTPTAPLTLLTNWNHWDAAIYTHIAQFGYRPPYELAFSPLYPLLIAAIGHPLSLSGPGYLVVGMLLSNAALLGALLIIYQLAADRAGEQVARRSVLYLCIFPTAFFFFTAYNEALFLLLTAGTFLALQRQRWWLAGLLGFFAALTRSAGVFLVFPLLYELWIQRASILRTHRTMLMSLTPIVLIPLGFLLYCLYCWKVTGNPLAFAAVQAHWSRHLTWPWHGIWQNLFEIFWNQPFGSSNQVHALLDLSATLGFLVLFILGLQRQRISYSIWTALLLLSMLLSASIDQHDALISNQRLVLELFPAFITLAMMGLKYPRLHQALLCLFPALLAILSLIFVMNKWMV